MKQFRYKERSPECLCEEAIDNILRGNAVGDYDLESLLEESRSIVYDNAYDEACSLQIAAVKAGLCSDLATDKLEEQLTVATNVAVNEYNAHLLANPSEVRDIIAKQVETLFDDGGLDLIGMDHDQQLGAYEDYCCGIQEERMAYDYYQEAHNGRA